MKRLFTAATIGLACLTLAGCVSEGPGYGYYEQSYVVYDSPGYIYRDRYRYRDWDRYPDRRDRYERGRRDEGRRDLPRWDRGDRGERHANSNYRERNRDSGRSGGSRERGGSSERGGRVWVPNN